MIYEYACDECRITTDIEKPSQDAGMPETCPLCNGDMRRVFHAPRLLNRSKPVSFRWDKAKLDAWDDRLAGFKHAEDKGPDHLADLRKSFGEQIYRQVLAHKKERYVN